jgi:hypothetical protein
MEAERTVDQLHPATSPDTSSSQDPKMETRESVDQHAAIALIATRPDLFARQGSVSPTWRRRNGITFGPYYRLSYRDDGRQCAIYLGRDGPLVQRVRQQLQEAQEPARQKRIFDRIEREARSALRANNRRLAALLRPLGLRLKGFEVRGWRTSPLRSFLPSRSRSVRFPLPSLPGLVGPFLCPSRLTGAARQDL